MKIKIKKDITYFFAFVITFITSAQVPPTPGGGGSGITTGGPAPPGPPGGPISDYLCLLVFVGLCYGVKKVKSLSTD